MRETQEGSLTVGLAPTPGVQILVLLISSCVTMGKL